MARALTPLEARVLGVLIEKHATVPDTYPLSLNTLLAGCNQKTARDPVLNLGEAELQTAIDGLKAMSLVFEGSSSRVTRYEHNAARGLNVPTPATAVLAVLMLRGPQTSAELRANTERLHKFNDAAAMEACLTELADRYPPRTVLLPRASGAREPRWAHLLCGEVQMTAARDSSSNPGASDDDPVSVGELVGLKAELAHQASELAALRTLVLRMAGELGMNLDSAADAAPPGH